MQRGTNYVGPHIRLCKTQWALKIICHFHHTTWRKHPIVKWTHGCLFCSISLTYPCSCRKFFPCRCNNTVSGRHLGRTTAKHFILLNRIHLVGHSAKVLPGKIKHVTEVVGRFFSILVYSLVNQTVIRPLNYRCVSISLASASFWHFIAFNISATHANNTLHFG